MAMQQYMDVRTSASGKHVSVLVLVHYNPRKGTHTKLAEFPSYLQPGYKVPTIREMVRYLQAGH